ncbi:hypothetical protein OsJ_24092 [Oryza sativa Japonica Group]|nr:hypothetical protein OsJ_24092 [Oryza sativa Japonica Group]
MVAILTDDSIRSILRHLVPADLLHAALACHRWRYAASSRTLFCILVLDPASCPRALLVWPSALCRRRTWRLGLAGKPGGSGGFRG